MATYPRQATRGRTAIVTTQRERCMVTATRGRMAMVTTKRRLVEKTVPRESRAIRSLEKDDTKVGPDRDG